MAGGGGAAVEGVVGVGWVGWVVGCEVVLGRIINIMMMLTMMTHFPVQL